MRIILAPDKFKGSADAQEVAAALEKGLRSASAQPDTLDIVAIPVADGGEGTVQAALSAGYSSRTLTVTGPVGLPVEAVYAALDDTTATPTAVIEMSQASGLDALPRDADGDPLLDALGAGSRGTGELIAHALEQGAQRIILGVGGSACTDGGTGMLTALGARFLDAAGEQLAGGGGALRDLARVDLSGLSPAVAGAEFVLAADVDNPLLGAQGAAAVFGPQKGAEGAQVAALEEGLTRWRDRAEEALGSAAGQVALAPGAGAAGGLGFAALAVLGAHRRPGIDVVLELVRLAERIEGASLVITGEGSLDAQSLGGKAPLGVLRTAQAASIPTIVVCGRSLLPPQQLREAGFAAVHTLLERAEDARSSMAEAPRLLQEVGAEIGQQLFASRHPDPAQQTDPYPVAGG
ncbi:glycerate kinase [Brachybacterium avium]|uniref:Glycerate kinase n=1 Tax=Brachybacterium avium TaxID=2017485 RepID=A0A220UER7_9MICO|nr:glycerate kinase [Brachybacterium avium]ASK66441.1 glycerate kinase [Brachybacterium avium]